MHHLIILIIILLLPALPGFPLPAIASDAPPIAEELIARNPKPRDLDFAISADDVLALYRQKKPLLLVDVRTQAAFDKAAIPDAIHVPLHFIKTKGYLKGRPFILVNEGRDYHRLEKECALLKKAGFNPSILDGGLNLWRRKGGPLGGDPFAHHEIEKIKARDFYQEKEMESSLVVDISKKRSAESLRLTPYAIHAPLPEDDEKAVSGFLKIVDKHAKKPTPTILMLDEDGQGYEKAKKLLAKKAINLFFLEGGLHAYKRFLMDLAASHKPRESRMRNLDKCKSCNEEKE